jgi:hypothetical protein
VSKKPPPPHIAALLENSPAGFFEKNFYLRGFCGGCFGKPKVGLNSPKVILKLSKHRPKA